MSGAESASVVGAGFRLSFTAAQWRELEHQALIYKYLVAGLPIPPDLLVPIRTGFESISARFFRNSSLGYSSYYGKKVDPEPGRCRRTDGKKWRCSKDAYLDSKYCERHMHRGRNRSRKPVESQSVSHSLPTAISRSATGSSSGSGSFHNLPWHSTSSDEGSLLKSNAPRWQIDPVSYGIINKDYRNIHEVKPEPNKPSTHPAGADSGSIQVLSVDQNVDNRSNLMLSGIQVDSSLNYGTYLQDFESTGHTSVSRLRQQHCFLSKDIGSAGSGKEESHAIRPFLDAWPKAGDSWSNLDEQRGNNTNFTSTQLSISVPVSLSENSARRACFPEGD